MKFLNPSALWLLLGVPVLIVIYLIRVRHEDKPVSSTFIWKLSNRFMKRRLPVQRIKKALAFLLQLLIVIGTALLAARPAVISGPVCDYIAVIDGSGSMQTVDENGQTRFAYALEKVQQLSSQTEKGHSVSVLLATDSPGWLVKNATSKKEVQLALETASCSLGGCNTDQVTQLVQQLCQTSKNPKVLFYTDNTYEEVSNLQVVDLNKNEWNVSVENLVSQPAEMGTTFTGYLTSHHKDARITVGLRVNGILEDVVKVYCQKDVSTAVTFAEAEITSYETAEIYVEVDDGLSYDNTYAIFHRSDRTYNVTLVSQSPLYLESALKALGSCEVSVSATLENAKLTGQDLYVFDGVAPDAYPTDGSVLVFGTQKLPEGMSVSDPVLQEAPLTTDTRLESNLYQGLSLEETVVTNYTPLRGNLSWEALFYCGNDSVISTKKTGNGTHFTLVSFDIRNSNLPMQTDFLVLMDNLVEFSVPTFVEGREHIAGDTVTLTVTPGAQQLYMQYPDGSVQQLSTTFETASVTADQVGIYTAAMTTGDRSEYADFFVRLAPEEFAVNTYQTLFLELSSQKIVSTEESVSEVWFWAALGLLLLILTEWGWYCREQR